MSGDAAQEEVARLMIVVRCLDRCGLPEIAKELARLATYPPNTSELKHIRTAEFHLRARVRKEDGPHLENAAARLLTLLLRSKSRATQLEVSKCRQSLQN